jgi:hypothetical protein
VTYLSSGGGDDGGGGDSGCPQCRSAFGLSVSYLTLYVCVCDNYEDRSLSGPVEININDKFSTMFREQNAQRPQPAGDGEMNE